MRHSARLLLVVAGAIFFSPRAWAQELGSGQLTVLGTRLTVSPADQTVPFDTPTVIETALAGIDPAAVPSSLLVRGELRGPEIDGVLRVEARPGEPLRIPRLRTGGSYRLDDIRLVDDGTLLAYAEPRSASVLVTEIVLTSVSSRPLTLEEIRSLGIVVGDDSFQMFRFVFGFGVTGEEIVFEIPVAVGVSADRRFATHGFEWRPPSSGRFRPPRLVPFQLGPPSSGQELVIPMGGCVGPECYQAFSPTPVVGVLAFPTDVALLHQFFSVLLKVQNGAPEGDVLELRDLAARISLPPALRQAETVPPTPLGVPVPVRGPGPDGELGTGDDVSVLVAQAEGQVEFLVEGLAEGSHVARFDIDGVLDGLPTGPRAVSGEALGAVVVRNPHLQVAINHPEIVRTDEAYPLHMTVSNLGLAPVNLLSLTLPVVGLSGVDVIGDRTRTIATLAPGEAETVTFDLVALRTGRVVASTTRTGSVISPLFEFSVGVSTDGIPLSPDSIVLPSLVSEELPVAVHRPALSLIGLGHSLATARQADLDPSLPRVDGGSVLRRVYRLVQAGRHRRIGEDLFDSLAVLAAEWQGARDGDLEWDRLRRLSDKGEALATGIGAVFEAEAQATSAEQMAERFYGDLAFLPDSLAVLADDDALSLRLESATSGAGLDGSERDLAFAERFPLGVHGTLVLVTRPEVGGYRAVLTSPSGGAGGLYLLLPAAGGGLRSVRWPSVSLAAGDRAEVAFDLGDASFTLHIDRFGDGTVDESPAGSVSALAAGPFTVVAARQNVGADVSGHVVDVLFTADVDREALGVRDASRFEIDGYTSDGGALTAGRLSTAGLTLPSDNLRMVRVVFDNPLGPGADEVYVRDVLSADGELLAPQTVALQITTTVPGGPLEGTVFGSDGQPVAFALVELFERDLDTLRGDCVEHKTGATRADAAGRFRFEHVRADTCDASDRYRLSAADPSDLAHGDAVGRIRFPEQTTELNVRMVGRGLVHGEVRYEDGTLPSGLEVRVWNPVFEQGRLAHVDGFGRFDAADVMVGAVEISANDDQGNFAFATVELEAAGAVAARDLVIVRATPDPTGQVRGTATDAAGTATVEGAILALYVDQVFVGSTASDASGVFDFGSVPAGTAEIEIFAPETGASGGRVFFELAADQVVDIAVPLSDTVGTIEGTVMRQRLDGSVVPQPGVIVWAYGQSANTVTGSDGTYRLEGVIAGTVQVNAADPATNERATASVTLAAGTTATRDLLLVEQAGVSGVILGEVLGFDGLPVQGALVHLANALVSPTRWTYEAITGADGRFTMRAIAFDQQGNPIDLGLPPGDYALHAVAGSLGGAAAATIRFPGDTPFVSIRFVRGDVRLRTFAEQLDGSLVGVTSQVQWRPTRVEEGLLKIAAAPFTVQTDSTGELLLTDVLAGPYEAFVSNPFHGERIVRGALVAEGQLNEHDIVFTETTGAVRGRVFDYDGVTPAAGVSLTLHAPNLADYDAVSDAGGRYAFELVPVGGFVITAVLDGGVFRTRRVSGQLDRGGQELEDVDIVLPRQGSVIGLVEDADGLRVPGAVVTLYEHAYPNRRLTVTADADGNFAIENVIAGGFEVSAQAPSLGGLGGRSGGAITDEGEIVPVLITLQPTGEIEGFVYSPVDGSPVPSARVSLHAGGLIEAIDSGEDGSFRFRLLPLTSYRVRAFDPTSGRFGESGLVTLVAHGEVAAADVTLQARGEVDGSVLEPGGVPIPGATVRLVAATPFFVLDTFSSTDTDGIFLFGGIPEGDFTVSVREPGGRRTASAQGTIAMEDELVTVDLVLQEFGAVAGSVLQPPGLPAGLFAGANVRMIGPSNVLLAASLDNPYLLEGLLPGEHFVLRAEELAGPHRGVASGRLGPDGGVVAQDVQMVALGRVTVMVADSFGNPVSGADVSLASKGVLGTTVLQGTTGADDRVTFETVAAGTVSAVVHHPLTGLRGTGSGTLALEGETVLLAVFLEPTGFVQGVAFLADGTTPAEGVIAALRQGSVFTFAEVADDGSFAFEGVRLGGWELTLQEPLGLGSYQVLGTLTGNGEIDDLGTLVLDEADPEVVAITPLQGSHSVPVVQPVTVTFDEPMDTDRYENNDVRVTRVQTGGSHGMAASWNGDATVLTLTPNQPFASGQLYEVVVGQDLVDAAGRRLAQLVRSTFTVADVVPPAVIDVLPRDAQNQVAVTSSVLITFSEPVDITSLSGPALELYDLTASAGITTTFQLRPNQREVVLTPAFGLVADQNVRVRVQGVEDLAGNVMVGTTETTFWTVDETPPTGSFLSPAESSTYTAGELIAAAVDASDNRGVAEVVFRLGTGVFVDDEAPYDHDIPAPRVATAVDLALEAEIVDIFGNTTLLTRSVHVQPRVNGNAPTATAPCLEEGDRVLAARELQIPLGVTDDEGIESYALYVDGALEDAVLFQHLPAIDDVFTWAPPTTALPGTAFVLRLEATDYAGNVGAYEVTVTTPADLLLLGDRTVDAALVAGRDAVFGDGVIILTEAIAPTALTLLPGTTLVADGGRATVAASAEVRVQCGGAIDLAGLGWAGGTTGSPIGQAPAGIAGSQPDAGGSHGGVGIVSDGAGPAGEVFGSVYAPAERGGGGALAWDTETGSARAGGGAVRLSAPSVIVAGEISVRAAPSHGTGNTEGGSGAGGSIWIEAGALRGAGLLDASGSDYTWCPAGPYRTEGAGGGGRIALDVGSLDGFDPGTQTQAFGGQLINCFDSQFGTAGAGTVYVRTAGDTFGTLRVDGGALRGVPAEGQLGIDDGVTPPPTHLPRLDAGTVVQTATDGADLLLTPAVSLRSRWLGAWMALEAADGSDLGVYRVIEREAGGPGSDTVRLEGAAGVTGAASYRGVYRFDRILTANRASVVFDSPWLLGDHVTEGGATLGGTVEAASLTVAAGTAWRVAEKRLLVLEVAGTLTVEAGAALDADGAGYQYEQVASGASGDAPEGIAGATDRAGGSHGGLGHPLGGGVPNVTYGSVVWPRLGGASSGNAVGDGGGAIRITASEVVVDGAITARGHGPAASAAGGSGAGGSIWIGGGLLRGSGTIDASGGDTESTSALPAETIIGAAGGGRVAVHADLDAGFDLATQVVADGGERRSSGGSGGFAAPGTVFVKDSASVDGRLYVVQSDPGTFDLPATPMPTLGSGLVGTVTADADITGAAWITDAGGQLFVLGAEGAWFRIGGVDYQVLALSVDRTAALLDGADGGVSAGDAWAGVWRFDHVTVDGGATLVFADPPELGGTTIGDGTIVQPVGSWVSPDEGATFAAGDTITAEVDTGTNPIVQVTFTLEGGSFESGTWVDNAAPWTADIVVPFVAAPTDALLDAVIEDSFGNEITIERTVALVPHANAAVPTLTAACVIDGDRVLPGVALSLAFEASDDEAIESHALVVDGVEIERIDFVATPSVTHAYLWTPPATAAPGTAFAVRLEARDYAGNVTAREVALQTPADLLLQGGGVVDAATVAGRDVVLAGGEFETSEPLAPLSLALYGDATLGAPALTPLTVAVAGEVRVQCGAAIDASGGGWPGGTDSVPGQAPAGIVGSETDAGGSHGGSGVVLNDAGPAGETYGSVYSPTSWGGGGAFGTVSSNGDGRPGGGALHLVAAEVVLGGDLLALGGSQTGHGASGAGGSIRIEAGTVRGPGTLDASGGDDGWCSTGANSPDGAGGGGRISLDVSAFDGFDPLVQARAHGGQMLRCTGHLDGIAGAGTIYMRTPAEPLGLLWIDGGVERGSLTEALLQLDGYTPPPTHLPRLDAGQVLQASGDGADLLVTPSVTLQPRWLGAWMALQAADGSDLGVYRVIEIESGVARLEGAAGVVGAATYRGVYRFDRVLTANRASAVFDSPWLLGDHTAVGDATLGGTVETASLTIAAGTSWRVAEKRPLVLEVAGTLTVEAGAALDADGAGYQHEQVPSGDSGDAPEGIVGAGNRAGGSHGGLGNATSGQPNAVYGSVVWPRHGGASAENVVGDGGGVVRITAAGVVVDGAITARGAGPVASKTAEGAGAGGSIWIEAESLSGTGVIDGSGGSASYTSTFSNLVGAGGGGRVALYVGDLSAFDVSTQVLVDGGERANGVASDGFAAPGTVFVLDGAATYGTLRIVQSDPGAYALPDTPLPAVGQGTIGTVAVDGTDPADVWVDDGGGKVFDLGVDGMWLRLPAGDFRILATSADRTELLLDGAAGLAAPGDAYVGIYRFDQLVVREATVVFGDGLDAGVVDVVGGEVIAPIDVQAPVIASVVPADGTTMMRNDAVAVSAAISDDVGVASATLTFDGTPLVDDSAPFAWTVSAPLVAVPTDVELTVTAVDAAGNAAVPVTRTIHVEPGDPPVITSVTPADGTVFEAGDPITVQATATDDVAVAAVTFTVGSLSVVDGQAPFAWTVSAPQVETPTDIAFVVDVEDPQLHHSVEMRTLHILPGVTVPPPTIEGAGCARDGTLALADTVLPIDFSVIAPVDDTVASWRVSVDGVEIASALGLSGAVETVSTSWTVPAGAAPGATYLVRIEATTAAGGLLIDDRTIAVPASHLVGPLTLDATDDGQDLVLGPGTHTVAEPIAPASIALLEGAVVVPAVGTALDLAVAGTVRLACGSTVDVSAQGYLGGSTAGEPGEAPPWVAASGANAGGSHGGLGAKGEGTGLPGEVYGSVYVPTLGGGGGGAHWGTSAGGTGGGVLRVEATEVMIDGTIRARGQDEDLFVDVNDSNRDGAGAGGSVVIVADTLRGDGTIDASGGYYQHSSTSNGGAGPGGGGRVAIWAGATLDFDAKLQVDVTGKQWRRSDGLVLGQSGPGTVLVAGPGEIWGRLIVDAGFLGQAPPLPIPATPLPALGEGDVAAIEVAGSDLWIEAASAFLPRWQGAEVVLEDIGGSEVGAFRALEVGADGRLLLEGAAAATSAARYRGGYRFDGVTVVGGASLATEELRQVGTVEAIGDTHLPEALVGSDLTVRDGATLRPSQGPGFSIRLTGNLVVEAGGTIDVSELGYLGGSTAGEPGEAPPWATASGANAGGSHGGLGAKGEGTGLPGEVYGSVYAPGLGGGGGGAHWGSSAGGTGGGVLRIEAAEVAIEGTVLARGEDEDLFVDVNDSNRDGAGAGGSVVIIADMIRGAGTIDASGGYYQHSSTSNGGAGPGGGGRVAIWAATTLDFDAATQVDVTGKQWRRSDGLVLGQSGPGTVLVAGPGEVWGRLIVDAGFLGQVPPLPVPATPLPVLGQGDVTAVEVAGSDLWIEDASAFLPRWHGAEVVLEDVGGSELGVYRALEVGADGRLLLEGAAAATSAARYRGGYRFDGLIVVGGASLATDELRHVGAVEVIGDTYLPEALVGSELAVRAGATLRPLQGSGFTIQLTGDLVVEAGGTIDVRKLGYAGGPLGANPGTAPVGLLASGYGAGGSHGGEGMWGATVHNEAGEVFDSVYVPSDGGGGGGASNNAPGGDGGGVLLISADMVVLDGTLLARGEIATYWEGAGAGGTVRIQATELSGAGAIDAEGGDYVPTGATWDGGGGGGRVALFVDDLSGFDTTTQVRLRGGRRTRSGILEEASPGTLYLIDTGATWGRLRVAAASDSVAPQATDLPPLGSGAVTLAEVEDGDLWLSAVSPFYPRWTGAWVDLIDSGSGLLGTYSVLEVDAAGRMRVAGASAHAAAVASYAGRYRFDVVETAYGATVQASDPIEVPQP